MHNSHDSPPLNGSFAPARKSLHMHSSSERRSITDIVYLYVREMILRSGTGCRKLISFGFFQSAVYSKEIVSGVNK